MTQAYTAEEFKRASQEYEAMVQREMARQPNRSVLIREWGLMAAALRIAARAMEEGVLEKAIRVCILGPENAELHPPMEYERNSANTIRSFLTKDTPSPRGAGEGEGERMTLVNRLIQEARSKPAFLEIHQGQVRELAAHAHSLVFARDRPSVEKIEEEILAGQMRLCDIPVRVRGGQST